ncbi:MAG: DUF1634 domain-containing protein [Acidobacteriota bacterium]|nr:DUF1634 domain-containing protein [Acidobacteriota bacterium]
MSAGSQPLGRLERHLGRLLIAGVVVSAALLAAGLGLWLAAPGHSATIWLLNAGLIALMGTPIMRVFVSFAEYVRLRDWLFAGLTVVVLAELALTVVVALSRR